MGIFWFIVIFGNLIFSWSPSKRKSFFSLYSTAEIITNQIKIKCDCKENKFFQFFDKILTKTKKQDLFCIILFDGLIATIKSNLCSKTYTRTSRNCGKIWSPKTNEDILSQLRFLKFIKLYLGPYYVKSWLITSWI